MAKKDDDEAQRDTIAGHPRDPKESDKLADDSAERTEDRRSAAEQELDNAKGLGMTDAEVRARKHHAAEHVSGAVATDDADGSSMDPDKREAAAGTSRGDSDDDVAKRRKSSQGADRTHQPEGRSASSPQQQTTERGQTHTTEKTTDSTTNKTTKK